MAGAYWHWKGIQVRILSLSRDMNRFSEGVLEAFDSHSVHHAVDFD